MDTLATQLTALITTGGSRNRLTLTAGDLWVALSGEKGGHVVECEPVTDDHLPRGIKLTDAQRSTMLGGGFTPIKHSSRMRRIFGMDGEGRADEVAGLLTGLLAQIYGEQPGELSLIHI